MSIESKEPTSKKESIDLEGFDSFLLEFKGETDRAAVILGAAKLDYLLYQILSNYFVPCAGGSDELLDGDSPLATFSAKINTAYRLGLIDSQFARALHLIRRIRNSFAHEATGVKLDAGPHRDRIKELVAPLVCYQSFDEAKDAFFKDKKGTTADFYTMLAVMVIRLDYLFHKLKPIKTISALTLVPPGYKFESATERQPSKKRKDIKTP
jgi:DNA-binding MltR family transcriptional regulator